MWCEFERGFDDLEGTATEANILQHAMVMARRDDRSRHELQVLQWVIEGYGAERLSLSEDHSHALAARVITRVIADIEDRTRTRMA